MVDAGVYPERRHLAFERVHPVTFASIPVHAAPSAQIREDITQLNQMAPVDGEPEFAIWLENIARMLEYGPDGVQHPSAPLFRRMAAGVREQARFTPAETPRDRWLSRHKERLQGIQPLFRLLRADGRHHVALRSISYRPDGQPEAASTILGGRGRHHTLLLGVPASGKTMLLRAMGLYLLHLARQQFEPGHRDPCYLDLSDPDERAWLTRLAHPDDQPAGFPLDFLLRSIAAGHLFVMIDSLDEAPDVDAAVADLLALAARRPEMPIVVCSRPLPHTLLPGFRPAVLLPLDRQQQLRFVEGTLESRFGAAPSHEQTVVDRFMADFDQRFGARGSAIWPLPLALMLKLFLELRDLPDRSASIGKAVVDALLDDLEGKLDGQPFTRGDIRQVTARAALDLHRRGETHWREDDIEAVFDAAAADLDADAPGASIWSVIRSAGLLYQQSHGARDEQGDDARTHDREARYVWLHPLVSDQLAAEALLDDMTVADFVARNRTDLKRWGYVLAAALRMVDRTRRRALAERLRQEPALAGHPALTRFTLDGILDGISSNHIAEWERAQQQIHALARGPFDREVAAAAVLARVDARCPLDRLGFLHHTLCCLGHRPSWSAFFGQGPEHLRRRPEPLPMSRVTLPDGRTVLIGTTPVTEGQYAPFAGPLAEPVAGYLEDLPQTRVDWWTAHLFAAWHDMALPPEADWHKLEEMLGPWGEGWPAADEVARSVWHAGNSGWSPHPVGHHPEGHRPTCDGPTDLVGHTEEWAARGDDRSRSTAPRSLGGSYVSHPNSLRPGMAQTHPASVKSETIGLRLYRSTDEDKGAPHD